MNLKFVILLVFAEFCKGFLLDTTTTFPKTTSTSGNSHYKELLNLITRETQSRQQLELIIKQLEQELLNTKHEVESKNNIIKTLNETFETQYSNHQNRTDILMDKYTRLQSDYDSLNVKNSHLEQSNALLERTIKHLEQDLRSLSQNESYISHEISNAMNVTKQIRLDTETTNNILDLLHHDVNSTVHDYHSLKNETEAIVAKLNNLHSGLELRQNVTLKLYKDFRNITDREQEMLNRTLFLEELQNMTDTKLELELDRMANRTAVTTCAKDRTDPLAEQISFINVKTYNGINDINLLKSRGIFTCEKPGLYLISAHVTTNSTAGYFRITNNAYAIATGYFSHSDNNATSAATVITRLDTNDTVSVITSTGLHVYGGYSSCLDIIQFQ